MINVQSKVISSWIDNIAKFIYFFLYLTIQ